MSNKPPEPDDLRALGDRLDDMRRRETAKKPESGPSPMGVALRFGSEMMSGLLVGGGIGWGLDYLFGTKPILLIVFFVLGAAAGIRNVMRSAKELNERAAAQANMPPAPAEDDEE